MVFQYANCTENKKQKNGDSPVFYATWWLSFLCCASAEREERNMKPPSEEVPLPRFDDSDSDSSSDDYNSSDDLK